MRSFRARFAHAGARRYHNFCEQKGDSDSNMEKNKLIKLLTNKGFYILLALSIGIVGMAGYVATRRIQKEAADIRLRQTEASSYTLDAVTKEEPKREAEPAEAVPDEAMPDEAVPAPEQQHTAAIVEAIPTAAVPVAAESFMLPMQGELLQKYSPTELVKSKTLNDWRVHPGIDILGDVGTQVKAAASGLVTSARFDDRLGVTVVIQHADGIETIYSNLQTGMLVEEGQEVARGDVIGGVGVTAPDEIGEPPHLHFAMKADGIFVDPLEYIDTTP